MSDVDRRALERSVRSGDPEGFALVRMLERQNNWAALCELGQHTFGVGSVTKAGTSCAHCGLLHPAWMKLRRCEPNVTR